MRTIPTLLLLVGACAPGPAPVPAMPEPAPVTVTAVQPVMSEDARAALATVQRLFDAMKARDTAALRQIFDPNARLYGLRMRRDSTAFVGVITGGDFINAVASATGPAWTERIFDPEVRVSGELATVWTEYDFHAGTTFSHCGVDAVQLLKVAGVWKIVAITDTRVRTGCPQRPAP